MTAPRERAADDVELPVFVARPVGPPPWPGVVVVHEVFGLTPHIMRVSQRLARQGFATCAPDFYFRSGGPGADRSLALAAAVTPEQLRDDLRRSVEMLRAIGASPVGITGFCQGGSYAYRAALWDVGVRCAAAFYGGAIPDELGTPACPVLLIYGDRDERIAAEGIARVKEHHGDDVVMYPNAGHGFMRDGSPSYARDAATDAWQRLLRFLRTHLG
jgi:carboxymethylenebutenolidase